MYNMSKFHQQVTSLFLLLVLFIATCLSTHTLQKDNTIQLEEDHNPEGLWKSKVQWKANWVKHWETRTMWVPVWRKVWGPMEIKEWIPLPKAPPTWIPPQR